MAAPTKDAARATPARLRRPVALALFARFTDELLYGAADVLLPTIRASLGLTYGQVGTLSLALDYVGAAVDPAASLLIDVWRRRWLMAAGALGVGVALVLIGAAPTFAVLLVAFGLYGAGSGPLAQTADVVLVESEPYTPARVFARATALDTLGALLGPALVAAWLWLRLDWRWLLAGLGTYAVVYGLALARTEFPSGPRDPHPRGLLHEVRDNLRAVLADGEALRWLAFLQAHALVEAPIVFRSIWLAEEAGMSQQLVAVYVAFITGCSLLGVLALERGLAGVAPRRLLLPCTLALVVLFPAWFLVPGVTARFLIGAPLEFTFAMMWPVARSASLSTSSARPGAVSAIDSVSGLVPLTLGVGLLAEVVGLTAASLGTQLVGVLLLVLMAWRWLPGGRPA